MMKPIIFRKKTGINLALALFLVMAGCLSITACNRNNNPKPKTPSEDQADIQGIYFIPHYGYMTSYFSSYLLFKDGSIMKNVILPPDSVHEKQSKKAHPDFWGQWKQAGDSITVTWNDDSQETWDLWYYGIPADKGEKLDGHYTSQFAVENKQYVVFDFTKDGRFSLVIKKGNTDETLTGDYQLNGYGISLNFDDGHSEHWAFNFYCIGSNTATPAKNTKAFIMAEDNYTMPKNEVDH